MTKGVSSIRISEQRFRAQFEARAAIGAAPAGFWKPPSRLELETSATVRDLASEF